MNTNHSHLLKYCVTEKQRLVIETLEKVGSLRKVATETGLPATTVRNTFHTVERLAASRGEAPANDLDYPLPAGQIVTGVSTLQKSPDGNLQWIKTKVSYEKQLDLMKEAVESLITDLPKVKAIPYKGSNANGDTIAVYPLGDPHVGMMSWSEETGIDWDLKIAEAKFLDVFDRLVRTAPNCKEAVIVNLGDFFHADNAIGVTARSGHHLDMDGRYAKMVKVGMKIMRRMIETALEHHEIVRVITVQGNHDDCGAMFLRVALANIYEDNPRVLVDQSPAPFHYVRFGKVLLGTHHGHSCKAPNLPGVMASDRAEDWGQTEYRYWLTGHIHHDSKKEYPGVTVESFRTLAAKDAYAAWGGYRSGQDSKCIVYHKDFGEVERHTVNISQAK